MPQRRQMDYRGGGVIMAAPTSPEHLPEAEPILPGHTLIRPSLTMLKSAVKFPHKEYQDGAGVYGSLNNLGMTYNGGNDRLQYSGFRRSSPNVKFVILAPTQKLNKERNKKKKRNKNREFKKIILSDKYTSDGLPVIYKDSLEMEELRKAPYDFFKALVQNGETRPFSNDKNDYQKVVVDTRTPEGGPILVENFTDKDDMQFYVGNLFAFQQRKNYDNDFNFNEQALRSSRSRESDDFLRKNKSPELLDDICGFDGPTEITYERTEVIPKFHSLEDLLTSNGIMAGESSNIYNYELRRSSKKSKKKKQRKHRESEESDENDSSRYYEPNPGNPYSVHKNRYNQNYLWNLEMTGDHMNINPHAPDWSEPVPQDDLFTIRKWWYFNQDDYRPFRR